MVNEEQVRHKSRPISECYDKKRRRKSLARRYGINGEVEMNFGMLMRGKNPLSFKI